MAKRKRKSNNAGDLDAVEGNKRSRQSPPIASQSISYGRVDPTYGQRSAIPGLDDDAYGDAESELACEDEDGLTGDALAYLRSVRIEASGIPTLLIAPKGADVSPEEGEGMVRAMYSNGIGDSRGYYEDGAYTAAPAEPLESFSASLYNGGSTQDPQAAYYAALLQRFSTLRQRLQTIPPQHAVERLDVEHPSYMASSTADYNKWRWRLRNTEPVPAQLVRMDKDTVIKLLRILGRQRFIKHEKDPLRMREQRRVALWAWGLLAKLPERGELVSEEVGVVRELGKRAVWVGVEIKGVDMRALDDGGGGGSGLDDGDADGDDGEDVLDAEINVDDGEAEGSDEDVGDNPISESGNDAVERPLNDLEPPSSSKTADPVAPQVAGSVSPSSAARHPTPSSPMLPDGKPTADSTSPTIPTNHEAHLPAPQNQDEEEQLAAARQRLLARLASQDAEVSNEEVGDVNGNSLGGEQKEHEVNVEEHMIGFRASLDTIITIAGEVYGQRDLLEFREVWS